MTRLRRLVLVLALVGIVIAVARRRALAHLDAPPPRPPSWPPLEPPPATAEEPPIAAEHVTTAALVEQVPIAEPPPPPNPTASDTWVRPVEGRCPDGHPVKANTRSRIFHVAGGRSYERTVPDRCYANPEDAIADGYRAAKM